MSTFFLNAAASYPDPAIALHTFFNAIAGQLPTGVQINFPNTTDTLDAETGKLQSSGTSAGAAQVTGAGGGTWSAPTGLECQWRTADVVAGKRVIGRTFLVPIMNGGSSSGAPGGTQTSAVTAAMAALMSAWGSAFIIWARPFAGRPAIGTKPALPARVGTIHVVTSSNVPARFVVLRSRRD